MNNRAQDVILHYSSAIVKRVADFRAYAFGIAMAFSTSALCCGSAEAWTLM